MTAVLTTVDRRPKMKSRRILALAIFATSGLTATQTLATDHSWSVGSGNWGSAGNWSPASVPTASDVCYLDHLVGGVRGVVSTVGTGNAATSVSICQLNELGITNH